MKKFALKHIEKEENGSLKIPFSKIAYSMFKHGSMHYAEKFGGQLGEAFCKSSIFKSMLANGKRFVVVPAPYDFVPTASSYLKDRFVTALNDGLIRNNAMPAMESKIYRTRSYSQDYSAMPAEERKARISGDGFYTDVKLLDDKNVIFIDDIRITGAHEDRIINMCESLGINLDYSTFIYFADVVSPDINAAIEDELNMKFIKNLDSIRYMVLNDNFVFNTRNIKFILGSSKTDFLKFVGSMPPKLIVIFYHYAAGNYYHQVPEFSENFTVLRRLYLDEK